MTTEQGARGPRSPASRRRVLTAIAASASGLMVPRGVFAATGEPAGLLPCPDVCVLTPESTEGPYYIDPKLVRQDIREDREGVPTLLRLQIVDESCKPIKDARVDIWHCDAQGIYSAFGGAERGQSSAKSDTFLRGTQMADDRGIAEFMTIYPGWYRGRTTHIHFKVLLEEAEMLTGQIFFPDALSEYLYLKAPAYKRDAERDILNENDFIARRATRASHAHVKEEDAFYLAEMIIGVDPRA